jgi:hypothetical protein
MVNKKEFSDITFLVESRPFYGHKVIISQLSEKLRAMFGVSGQMGDRQVAGFKEENQCEIIIDNISFPVFELIMTYLYSGEFDLIEFINSQFKFLLVNEDFRNGSKSEMEANLTRHAVDLLVDCMRVADEYFLDEIKNSC